MVLWWLSGVVVAGIGLAGPPTLELQVAVLAIGMVALGLPHGALDLEVLRVQGRRAGWTWLVGYAGLAVLAVVAFRLAPTVLWSLFLVASAWHFGRADGHRLGVAEPAFAWTRGALVIGALLWRDPEAAAAVVADLGAVAPTELGLPALLAAGLIHAGAAAATRRVDVGGEAALLAAMAYVLPPVLFFTVYFIGWHSLAHMLRVGRALGPGGLRRLGPVAAGWTLLALVGGGAAWWLLSTGTRHPLSPFVLLSVAVTLPHLLVVELVMDRAGERRPAVSPPAAG